MPGLLSQVLDNLSQIEATMRSVQVPPSATQQIQEAMLSGLDQLRDDCNALRDQVTDYATPALAQLNDITAQLNADQPSTDELIDELRQVQAGAQGISAQAENVFNQAKTILDNQNAYQQQLSQENQATQDSYNQQQSQISDLQSKLDEAETMKSTMSILTFGLSDLVARISGIQDDLDKAEQEMRDVQMRLMYQSMIIQGTTNLLDHTSKVVDILSGVRNTITMVTADLDSLFAAHSGLDKTVVLRLFVGQTTGEVQSLLSDAS